ncbi:MAG: hypothetical protein AB3X44_21060 [Leptothrix sp. (in: b-proteobacteria)]
MKILGRIIGLAIFMHASTVAAYCDRYPTVQEEFKSSELVVSATVVREKLVPDSEPTFYAGTIYYLKVNHIYKGAKITHLKLFSENTTSRFLMDIGTTYLVFANHEQDLFKNTNTYYINSCGNSKQIKDQSTELHISKFSP